MTETPPTSLGDDDQSAGQDGLTDPFPPLAVSSAGASSPVFGPGRARPVPRLPVRLELPYPPRLSRLLLFVKWLFAFPLLIWLAFYSVAAYLVEFFALFAILFTGRYPVGFFNFVRTFLNTQYRVWAYWPLYMTDRWRPTEDSPLRLEIDQPEKLSRWLVIPKALAVVFGVVSTLLGFATLALVVVVIPVWFVILITGRYPRGLFDWALRVLRWSAGISAWGALMRDEWSLFGRTKKVKALGIAALVIGPISVISSFASHNFSVNTNLGSRVGAIVGVPEAMKVVDQFMVYGQEQNVDAAFALADPTQLSRSKLAEIFARREYFAGYTGTAVTGFHSQSGASGRLLEIDGKVHYEGARDHDFHVVMVKKDGHWLLAGLSISR